MGRPTVNSWRADQGFEWGPWLVVDPGPRATKSKNRCSCLSRAYSWKIRCEPYKNMPICFETSILVTYSPLTSWQVEYVIQLSKIMICHSSLSHDTVEWRHHPNVRGWGHRNAPTPFSRCRKMVDVMCRMVLFFKVSAKSCDNQSWRKASSWVGDIR